MTPIVEHRPGSARRLLLRGGCVLSLETPASEPRSADVLIENGIIKAVAPNLEAQDAEVIDVGGQIVMPGFVDSHRHLWQGLIRNMLPDGTLWDYFEAVNNKMGPAYAPQNVYAGTLLSALGALNAGVTTVLDWAHIQNTPEHTDASVDALRHSGIRAVFGFGPPGAYDQGHRYPDDIVRIKREHFSSDDQLLTLALAAVSPEHMPDEQVKAQWRKGREAHARISVHAGLAGMGTPGQIERFGKEGLLGPDVTLIHCATFSDTEWKIIAETGTTVSLSVPVELQMGHGLPPIQKALDVGLRPSLSVDVETSAPSDFFTQMRATLALQRGMAFERKYAGHAAPALIGVRDVLAFATLYGAEANGLASKVGSLVPGKRADIIVLRTDTINVMPINDVIGAVVLGMDTSNVDTVIVDGNIVKRHGMLLGVNMQALDELVYQGRNQVFSKSSIPCAGLRTPHNH